MEWTSPWVIGPLCTGLGVLVGMLIMVALGRDGGSARALGALQEEFETYRDSVNQHFATTSELFQDMTEKYRDVYNHLATGAQEFGRNVDTPPRLEIVQPAAQLAAGGAAAADVADEPPRHDEAPATMAESDVDLSDDVDAQTASRPDGELLAVDDDEGLADIDIELPESPRTDEHAMGVPEAADGDLVEAASDGADQDGDDALFDAAAEGREPAGDQSAKQRSKESATVT